MKPTYEQLEQELKQTKVKLAKTEEILQQALLRITKLEEIINKNSNNSSKPPSTDQKANTKSKSRKKGSRGNGVNRVPYPPERVDEVIQCTLKNCPHCNSKNLTFKKTAETLQQVDLPKVAAIVTEYSLLRYHCSDCKKNCKGELPPGVPHSAFGPKLMALVTALTGAYLMPKRDALQLIKDLYDIDISLGSVPNIEERVTQALSEVFERIHTYVLDSELCKHLDETSWRDSGKKHYAWLACNKEATVVKIYHSRSAESFESLVKGKMGFNAVTDRYATYNRIKGIHQYCLAHLIRDFQKYAERDGPDGEIGAEIVEVLRKACAIHIKYRDKEELTSERNRKLGQLKRKFKSLLDDGFLSHSNDLSSLCNRLYEDFEHIWAFTKVKGMEPTNNLAERNIRNLVIRRKRSYGTRSERGRSFIETITSIVVTIKQQKKNIYDFLTDVVSKYFARAELPMIEPSLGF